MGAEIFSGLAFFWLLFLAMKKSNESPRRSLVLLTHSKCLSPCENKQPWRSHTIPVRWHSRTAGQALALWQKSLAFLQRQSMAHQVTNHHALFGKSVSKTPILHIPYRFSTTFAKNPTIFSLARRRFVREKGFVIHDLNFYFKEFMSSAAT